MTATLVLTRSHLDQVEVAMERQKAELESLCIFGKAREIEDFLDMFCSTCECLENIKDARRDMEARRDDT